MYTEYQFRTTVISQHAAWFSLSHGADQRGPANTQTHRFRVSYTPEHDGEEIQKTKKTKAARLNSRTQNGDGIHPLLPFVPFTQAVVQGKHSHLRRTRERVMLVIKKRRYRGHRSERNQNKNTVQDKKHTDRPQLR